jgi:hypothetical protein
LARRIGWTKNGPPQGVIAALKTIMELYSNDLVLSQNREMADDCACGGKST